jgi:hypothetical protein
MISWNSFETGIGMRAARPGTKMLKMNAGEKVTLKPDEPAGSGTIGTRVPNIGWLL